jgi:TolA-binding protein
MKLTIGLTLLTTFTSCDMASHIERRSQVINQHEDTILHLSKENRILMMKISSLKTEITSLESKNQYLKVQLKEAKEGKRAKRTIASVRPMKGKNDLVNFDVYKWKPGQVLAVAEKEFTLKNFEKSAQFFNTFKVQFPNDKNLDDQFLFQAGVAAFESGKHYDWAVENFQGLVQAYPTSKFYRGAKLWMALANLKLGHNDKFFEAVEEFRMKYRNTSEWKILSTHYEKIVQRHKKN